MTKRGNGKEITNFTNDKGDFNTSYPIAQPGGGGGAYFGGNFGDILSVYILKSTSMSFVPTKYLKYQQHIERNSRFFTVKNAQIF